MPRRLPRLATACAVASFLLPGLALSGFVACRGGGSDGTVVARFGDETVTAAEVDARVLALPAGERPRPGEDLEAWYADQIREIVVERRLLEGPGAVDAADDEAFAAARREAEKQLTLQICLAPEMAGQTSISEEDIRAAYEARREDFSAPERRAVYQIFLRREPGSRERIEALRDRVLAGESFKRLAGEQSDSETRHRDGFVGWFVPGRLPEGFEEVVFAIEEGVPSTPVATREGFHLFYVDQVLPERSLTYEEARPLLRRRLQADRREAALAALDARVEPPSGALILDREGLAATMRQGDDAAVVLRIGGVTWTLADLKQRIRAFLAQEGRPEGSPTVELAWRLLDQARRNEELFGDCREGDRVPRPELVRRLQEWEHRARLAVARHRRLAALAERDEERLRLFYESNIGDFSTPPTWTIRRLRVPVDEDAGRAVATMGRLEAAARGRSSLDALHAELGGEIDQLEPMSLAEVARSQPKLPPLLAPLRTGQLSAPYRSDRGLEIVEVTARTDARPLPFEDVRAQVTARYVEQYTRELYDELSREILQGAELEIDPEALASLRAAGVPEAEITVEQLEELLDRG